MAMISGNMSFKSNPGTNVFFSSGIAWGLTDPGPKASGNQNLRPSVWELILIFMISFINKLLKFRNLLL